MPPFLPFFLFALLIPFVPRRYRPALLLAAPVVGGLILVSAPENASWNLHIFDYALEPVRFDRLSLLFGYLFNLAAFIAALFSWHVRDPVQQASGLLYPGSALGAVFAGDLLTLFVFWELMAVTSVFLVWARGTDRAYRSGLRYLVIQVVSGLLLLSGALVYVHQTGTLTFGYIGLEGLAAWLIFLAFGIKCAFPLLLPRPGRCF
jgi:multicomponent Na+:H+ antiporter subunit D